MLPPLDSPRIACSHARAPPTALNSPTAPALPTHPALPNVPIIASPTASRTRAVEPLLVHPPQEGTFAANNGSTSCTTCPDGYMQQATGASQCIACAAGAHPTSGAAQRPLVSVCVCICLRERACVRLSVSQPHPVCMCIPPPCAGLFSTQGAACALCEARTYSTEAAGSCDLCAPEFFLADVSLPPSTENCVVRHPRPH